MVADVTLARHLAELGLLEALVRNLDYETLLVEKSSEVPYHTLLIELEADPEKAQRQLAVTFYPIDEDEFENISLLQYYSDLPFEVPSEKVESIKQLLIEVNSRLILGNFSMTAAEDRVSYRYVQVFNSEEMIVEGVIEDVLILIGFTVTVIGNAIARFVMGELSAQQVKQMLAGSA